MEDQIVTPETTTAEDATTADATSGSSSSDSTASTTDTTSTDTASTDTTSTDTTADATTSTDTTSTDTTSTDTTTTDTTTVDPPASNPDADPAATTGVAADTGDTSTTGTTDEAPVTTTTTTDATTTDTTSDTATDDTTIAIASSGMFGDPLSPGSSVFEVLDANGGDDNRFEWGVPVSDSFVNVLQFDGLSLEAAPDEIVSLGDLLYTNGTVNQAFNGEFPFTLKLDIGGLDSASSSSDSSSTDASSSSDSVNEVADTTDSSVDETAGSDTTADESLSFEFLFDIFNSPNTTGDAVLDGDRLRLNSGGVAPVSFEIDGQEYTIQLIGFSSDGGNSIRTGFNSPEESTANAELFAKIVPLSDDLAEFYEPLPNSVVFEFIAKGGISIGGDATTGEGAVAVSLLIKSEITLQVAWGNVVSGLTSDYEPVSDADGDSDGDGKAEIDLDDTNTNVVVTTDADEDIDGTIDSDIIVSGGGDDDIDCAEGNDIGLGLDGDDDVDGGDGIDVVNGNQGEDDVHGGAGDDIARGGQGDDDVDGGGGDDVVTGDRGEDMVTGGDGADTFALMAKLDIETQTSFSLDIITDYQAGVDRLAISAERFEKQDISFSIGDYNSDGSPDFIASFTSGQIFGVVLNVSDIDFVKDDIIQASMDDFVPMDDVAV